jgi:hypothetical protein
MLTVVADPIKFILGGLMFVVGICRSSLSLSTTIMTEILIQWFPRGVDIQGAGRNTLGNVEGEKFRDPYVQNQFERLPSLESTQEQSGR